MISSPVIMSCRCALDRCKRVVSRQQHAYLVDDHGGGSTRSGSGSRRNSKSTKKICSVKEKLPRQNNWVKWGPFENVQSCESQDKPEADSLCAHRRNPDAKSSRARTTFVQKFDKFNTFNHHRAIHRYVVTSYKQRSALQVAMDSNHHAFVQMTLLLRSQMS